MKKIIYYLIPLLISSVSIADTNYIAPPKLNKITKPIRTEKTDAETLVSSSDPIVLTEIQKAQLLEYLGFIPNKKVKVVKKQITKDDVNTNSTVNKNKYVFNKLPQPPLTTQSSNEANQLNDNQNLITNPPFTSVTKVNTGQAKRNKDTQNTSSQQANLSEKNDTVEKVAESEIEKKLSQELPSVKENTQSTQKEPTDNQQGVTQNPKSEEVIEDKTSQEE